VTIKTLVPSTVVTEKKDANILQSIGMITMNVPTINVLQEFVFINVVCSNKEATNVKSLFAIKSTEFVLFQLIATMEIHALLIVVIKLLENVFMSEKLVMMAISVPKTFATLQENATTPLFLAEITTLAQLIAVILKLVASTDQNMTSKI
jgi:hypothetical protein